LVIAADGTPSLDQVRPPSRMIAASATRSRNVSGKSNAMFVALYDEHTDALEDEWMRAFDSLRFSESFALAQSAELASVLSGTTWRCDNGFVHMKFRPTTWTLIHVAAAMAAMGRNVPY